MFVINLMLHQECAELVTEEDSLHPGTTQPQQAAKTRQTSHPEKIVVFLSTARTSSTQCEVAKPAMEAKAWQHQSGTRARLSTKELCTAHQERRTTFLRVPLHHYSNASQTRFRCNLFVGFFEVTRELRQRRMRETFLGIEWPKNPDRSDDEWIGTWLHHFGLPQAHRQSTAQLDFRRLHAVPKYQTGEGKRTKGNGGDVLKVEKGPKNHLRTQFLFRLFPSCIV